MEIEPKVIGSYSLNISHLVFIIFYFAISSPNFATIYQLLNPFDGTSFNWKSEFSKTLKEIWRERNQKFNKILFPPTGAKVSVFLNHEGEGL